MIVPNFVSMHRLITKVHFNRVAIQRGDDHVWTVHTSEGCFAVKSVHINAPVQTVYNKEGRQPRAFFRGRTRVVIREGHAYLLA